MPITPNGTRFCPINSPLGRCFIDSTSPTGSSSPAICLSPSAIWAILASVSISRSTSPGAMPFSFAYSTSVWFASNSIFIFAIK